MTRSKTQYLPTKILIVIWVLVWVCMASDAIAWYPATYAESAHGNPSYGVNRSGTECPTGTPCPTGDCTHCHDTFDDSICGVNPLPLMLFYSRNPTSQTDNFCFQCHKVDGSVQEREGGITNYDYGSTFGGGTANSTNIKDAFNFGPPNPALDGSSHNLLFIRNWVGTKAAGDWMTVNTNACVVCHDPHLSQKNFPVEATAQGGVKTAVRRPDAPSSGVNQPNNIYGDEADNNELLSEVAGGEYQAPYRVGTTTYEPDGLASEPPQGWGSNLPNFPQFCLSCHSAQIPTSKHDAPTANALTAIDWGSASPGDVHGLREYDTPSEHGTLKPPYVDRAPYVLSCMDCHEPHGSPNPFLLRTSVNGIDNITVTVGANGELYMYDFCSACHTVIRPHQTWNQETEDCTAGGVCHVHGNGGGNGI